MNTDVRRKSLTQSEDRSVSSHEAGLSNQMISICIPAYRRPKQVEEALISCFAQTYANLEVIVSDDSPDEETEQVVASYIKLYPGKLRYQHNHPALGENENVNQLFELAQGSRLVVLHDDDLLLPDALERLAACWESMSGLDVAFGKQYVITHDGVCLDTESEKLNEAYQRVPANAGLQKVPILAGILRMFPNDGYMVRTDLARKVGYRSSPGFSPACDTDFGLRLCAEAKQIWFVDHFTCKYRDTHVSQGKTALPAPFAYEMLRNLKIPPEAGTGLIWAKKKMAPSAVSGFAQLGQTRKASSVFFSRDYPIPQRFSPKGIYHAMKIFRSLFR